MCAVLPRCHVPHASFNGWICRLLCHILYPPIIPLFCVQLGDEKWYK